MLDPESLRCFELCAATLNFRAASRLAALSPAAFGDRIQRLEDQLGVRLFHRTTRSVQLTAAGERLLPEARNCLRELDHLRRLARELPDITPWALTIGTRWELGLSWLTPALAPLREAVPERTIHLAFGDSPELFESLRRGRMDAVVTSYRVVAPDLVSERLHDEEYRFVAAPSLHRSSPLRRREDASAHVLLDTHADLPLFRYLLDALGESEPWPFRGIERLGAIGAVRSRLLAGAGVAVLPAYFVQPELAAGRLEGLLPEVPLRSDVFRLWWQRGHPRDTQLRHLAEELRALPLR